MANTADIRRALSESLTVVPVRLLARLRVSPNTVTFAGFALTLGAAALIVLQDIVWAGVLVIIAGYFDMLDGALARDTGRATTAGAVLDSTLDRVSEAALFLALIVFYHLAGSLTGLLLASIALISSFLVSYIRARAEAEGRDCRSGLMTRPERVIILTLGLLLSPVSGSLLIAIAAIAFFSTLTVFQRLIIVCRKA